MMAGREMLSMPRSGQKRFAATRGVKRFTH